MGKVEFKTVMLGRMLNAFKGESESCWRTLDEAGCAADKMGRIRLEITCEKL